MAIMSLAENQYAIPLDFDPKEKKIKALFLKRFEYEVMNLNALMFTLDKRLEYADHFSKERDTKPYYASLFMAQSYSLLDNSLKILSCGYELESLVLIRPVAERAILTIYFCEFPKDLAIYRKPEGHKKFYAHLKNLGYSNYLQGALERIEREGVLWSNSKGWAKELYESLVDEPSRLLHADEMYGFVASVRGSKIIRGPHYRIRSSKIILEKIRQAALWSIMALLVSHDLPLSYGEDIQIRYAFKDLYGIDTLDQIQSLLKTPPDDHSSVQ